MSYRNRNFDRNNYGGSISRNVNVDPWDTSNDWGMRGGGNNNLGGGGGGNQGGGGGGGGGNFNQNPSNELAMNLLNLLRNNQAPPSLLDLPQADMRGYGYGRNSGGGGGGGDFDRFDDRRMSHNNNRHNNNMNNSGGGGGGGGNNNNNNRNRRIGGGGGGGGGNNGPRHNNHPQHMPNNNKAQNHNTGMNRNSGGIRKPNSLDRSKKVLAKGANANSSNKANNSAPKPDNAAAAKTNPNADQSHDDWNEEEPLGPDGESLYADVPSEMFYCHLCKKHMWDCTSFENHVKGRTHQMMKEGVEESYRLKANMIRQEAKIDEQLKSIEVERLKRIGKNVKASNVHREYCTMCDLHFYGHLSTHRKSEGHLNLKKFLHPKCSECSKEFPTRIEFDAHLLSKEHMVRAAAKANRTDTRRKNQLNILTETDEVKDLREEKEKVATKTTTPATAATTEGGAAAEEGGDKAAVAAGEEGATVTAAENGEAATAGDAEEKAEETVEPEDPDVILDFVEGTTEIGADVETKLPKYNSARAIGTSMIAKLECYECKLCNRYFDNEKTAEVHSRTVYHHKMFTKFLTEKANETKIAQKRAAATIENEKRKRARMEKESEGENGEATAVAAAAKPAGENGDAVAVAAAAEATTEIEGQPEKKLKVEMYDPCEATEDDEVEQDVTMAEVAVKVEPVAADPVPAVVKAVTKDEPATPVLATPPAPIISSAGKTTPGSGGGTPRGGRGGNRGNNRGRGRGRRF